jgi:hypothetical protein
MNWKRPPVPRIVVAEDVMAELFQIIYTRASSREPQML